MTGNYLTYTEIPARCPPARMQIDNHNYEVYTNNDLIAIHTSHRLYFKPRTVYFSADRNDEDQLQTKSGAKSLTILCPNCIK